MEKKIKLDKLEIRYFQEGKKAPLILLHGWGKSGRVYSFLQRYCRQEFCSAALDLPGFGQSPLPPETWGVREYADSVFNFAEKKKWGSFYLLGHSFGGRIALEMAISHPERIKKLILTGVPVLRKSSFKRCLFWLIAKSAGLFFKIPPFSFSKKFFSKVLYHFTGERDYSQTSGRLRQIFKKVINYDPRSGLHEIKVPTLIVWGEDDKVTPLKNAFFLNEKIKNIQLKIVKKANHKLPYQKPKEFARIVLGFLKG
ncbi:MAG: alpha/beta hydrolase [Candidatus Pacebacteria bacterium]|nr:alpha/beta hydrolase [Candidatus Paceibacterota bacterium]